MHRLTTQTKAPGQHLNQNPTLWVNYGPRPHPRTSQPHNRHRQAQGIRSRVLAEALGMPVAFFDVVSLHTPEPPATQGMISAVQIAHMKPSHQRLARHRDATGRAGQPNFDLGEGCAWRGCRRRNECPARRERPC